MAIASVTPSAKGSQLPNWKLPSKVWRMKVLSALAHTTVTPPSNELTPTYTKTYFWPRVVLCDIYISAEVAASVRRMKTTNGIRTRRRATASPSRAFSAVLTSGPDVPMRNAPVTQRAMPMRLALEIDSRRKICARMADRTTLHAPNGATRDAGAKAKAAKLPTSPAAIRKVPIHQVGLRRNSRVESERVVGVGWDSAEGERAACGLSSGVEMGSAAEGGNRNSDSGCTESGGRDCACVVGSSSSSGLWARFEAESVLCADFWRVREHAMRVFPHMASRKPIILAVRADRVASTDIVPVAIGN